MKLKSMLDELSAKYLYRLSYLANNYRDPFLSQAEAELGLNRPEVTILFCLAYNNGINAKDIAEVTRQPKNTLSRGAFTLEKKGLIWKEVDQKDRRRCILRITPKGTDLCAKIVPLYEEYERRMLAPLNREELAMLDQLMTRLCNYVTDQS